jgi:hypothetical protein
MSSAWQPDRRGECGSLPRHDLAERLIRLLIRLLIWLLISLNVPP